MHTAVLPLRTMQPIKNELCEHIIMVNWMYGTIGMEHANGCASAQDVAAENESVTL